jgi:hypothetical protein
MPPMLCPTTTGLTRLRWSNIHAKVVSEDLHGVALVWFVALSVPV